MFLTFILHLCVFKPTNNISGQMVVHCFVLIKNLVSFLFDLYRYLAFRASVMKLYHHPKVLVAQWLKEANDNSGGHKDVHLVCDDGTLAWSSLLLATDKIPALAKSFKTLNKCSFCVTPTVVIIPNTR